jgi:predicted aconitase with swiveling domain
MTEKITLRGRGLTSGVVEGEAIVTKQPLNFFRAYADAFHTGRPSRTIGDKRHELYGKDLSGKILVFPYGVGSCACGALFLQTIKTGIGPRAVVNIETDEVVLAGAVFADIFYHVKVPMVHKLNRDPFEVINTGDHVKVDADRGIVEVTKSGARK